MIYMDLYQIAGGEQFALPEGYRFSWIAFDPDSPDTRVLFDCHSPKGPHFHLNNEKEGTAYQWQNLKEAERFFFEIVEKHFGKLTGGKES